MKTTKALVIGSLFILLSIDVAGAEQCFPSGSIIVDLPGSTGQTTHAVVSPMGAITIDYPNGSLQGKIDSLGHFTASNDYTTVSGNVNTSCPGSTTISPTPSLCSVPYPSGCTKESDYQLILTAAGLYGTTNETYVTNELSTCRKQIDDYQTATANWQKCTKDSYGYDTLTKTWGATLTQIENKQAQADAVAKKQQACFAKNALYLESSGSCMCRTGESFNKEGYCAAKVVSPIVTSPSCPPNASLGSDNNCRCNTSYGAGSGNDEGKCVLRNIALQEMGEVLYGSQVHYNEVTTNFECNSGYIFENGTQDKNNKCVSMTIWCQKNYDDPLCKDQKKSVTTTKVVPAISVKSITPQASQKGTVQKVSATTTSASVTASAGSSAGEGKKTWLKKLSNLLSRFHF